MARTSEKGSLPNLIVIAALKCGTTSSLYYLGLHPQIYMSRKKELSFLIEERNRPKGIAWYMSHFTENTKIHGETTPICTA
jgi:hypothetical protein